jgi:four helix bundle suffix protein
MSTPDEKLLPPHGNYAELLSYRKAEVVYVRKLGRHPHQTYETYREFCETRPPEVVANIALCLIHQTNYLLDQQLRRLETDFVLHGGRRELMTRARLQYRHAIHPPNESHATLGPPTAKPGPHSGQS